MKIFYINNDGVQDINKSVEVSPPKFEGGPGLIRIRPPSLSPKVRNLQVLLGREFEGKIPERGTLSKTAGGHPIIIKERDDDREGALVFVYWMSRNGLNPDLTKGTGWAEIILWDSGRGADYGYVALIKLKQREWHFSMPAGRDKERKGIMLKNNQPQMERWSVLEFEELTGQKGED